MASMTSPEQGAQQECSSTRRWPPGGVRTLREAVAAFMAGQLAPSRRRRQSDRGPSPRGLTPASPSGNSASPMRWIRLSLVLAAIAAVYFFRLGQPILWADEADTG